MFAMKMYIVHTENNIIITDANAGWQLNQHNVQKSEEAMHSAAITVAIKMCPPPKNIGYHVKKINIALKKNNPPRYADLS